MSVDVEGRRQTAEAEGRQTRYNEGLLDVIELLISQLVAHRVVPPEFMVAELEQRAAAFAESAGADSPRAFAGNDLLVRLRDRIERAGRIVSGGTA